MLISPPAGNLELVSQPVLKINCNDRVRRVVLRILGFTYPFWGLAAGVCIVIWSSSSRLSSVPLEAFLFMMCPPVFLGCYCLSISLLKNNILASPELLKFPGISRKTHKTADLNSVQLKDANLHFSFASGKTERIPLSRFEKENGLKLLSFLNKNAKNCRIDEETRQAIEQYDAPAVFDPDKELQIPYNGHFKLTAFFDICKQYERFFWSAWLAICLPVALFLLPFVMYCPAHVAIQAFTGTNMPPDFVKNAMEVWLKLWYETFKDLLATTGNVANFWQHFLSNSPEACLVFIALAAMALLAGLLTLAKPTALVLNKKGFRSESAPLGFLLDLRYFPWSECRVVCLKSSEKKVAEDKLEFFGEGGKLAELELKGISKLAQRQLLKQAIEHYAPHVEIDPAFLQSVVSPQSQSYTELWLQSLSSPPKRDRLTPLQASDSLAAGQYQIMETIGAGGQGVAYLARNKGAEGSKDEYVVVKEFMLPVYVDRRARQQALERFEQEAQTLRSINHANIVGLKDHFIEDHRAYLVLERINGKSLRKLFSQKPVTDEKLMEDLLRQSCLILDFLHGQEPPMVHRDFTPDNLILDESGILKLIDFNVARQEGSKARMTVVGKHAYMPPEQFAGKPVTQSDIYAMGASIFYCLTGKDPEPFTQSELPSHCPCVLNPAWNAIVSKCTSLSTATRFKSGSEIIEYFAAESTEGEIVSTGEMVVLPVSAKPNEEVLS